MEFNTVDLHRELQKEKQKNPEHDLIAKARQILDEGLDNDLAIAERIGISSPKIWENIQELDERRIYDLKQIKRLCIKFRLRFLDAKYFKGELPYEAIQEIKAIEKSLGTKLEGFKIIAPKSLFKLSDKDSDPILFLQLSENKFYFIHKWGGEINRFRSTLAYPLRSFETLFVSLAILALLFSIAVPTPNTTLFIFLVVHSFIAICGMACLVIMTLRENFSDAEWDSQFFS